MYKLITFALVAAVSCKDLIEGPAGGRKIYDANKEASPAIWKQKDEVTIKANDTDVISRIVVTDMRPDKSGEAKITDGGQGFKNVTVELESPTILRGYTFHIEVYAVKENGEDEETTEEAVIETDIASTEQVPVENNTQVNINKKEVAKNAIVAVEATTEHVIEATTEKKVNSQHIVAPIITGKSKRSATSWGRSEESDEDYSDEHHHFYPHFGEEDEQNYNKHRHNSHEVKYVSTSTDSTKKGPTTHVEKAVSPTVSTNSTEVTTVASTDSSTTLSSSDATTLAATDTTTSAATGTTKLASTGSPATTASSTTVKSVTIETVTENKLKPFRSISEEMRQRVVFGDKRM